MNLIAAEADYPALDPAARAVLDFWFGEPGAPAFGVASPRWFKRDEAFDAQIWARFGATLEAARRGECDAWLGTPLGAPLGTTLGAPLGAPTFLCKTII